MLLMVTVASLFHVAFLSCSAEPGMVCRQPVGIDVLSGGRAELLCWADPHPRCTFLYFARL